MKKRDCTIFVSSKNKGAISGTVAKKGFLMTRLILMLRNKIDSEFHDCQTYLISPKVFDTQNIAVLILNLKQIDLTAEKCLQEIQKKMANSADLVQTPQSELVLHCLQT